MGMQFLQLLCCWVVLLCADLITGGVFLLGVVVLVFWCIPTSDVRPASDFERREARGKCVLHLKGSTDDVLYDEEDTKLAMDAVLNEVRLLKPVCCVWDGQPYSEESFTRLIPAIYDVLQADVQLVAFVAEDELELFERSWCSQYIPITVYTCDSALGCDELSTFALDATHVFCFGADDGVHGASNYRPGKSMQFVTFPFQREPTTAKGTRECSKLCD
jgi:hypothetical protein